MPGSDVPVIRQPFKPGDALPYWSLGSRTREHHLLSAGQRSRRRRRTGWDRSDEADMIELLRVALKTIEAPAEQFERLGIA